ncbi:carboxymuconolactone decarboxylase family protein [Nocardia violaceofusca]|uniref:carboxymuconolactone decarboxylase family protein n=1 Tax=Nocardia violaceofusca TaxID=941182 RepID=UPI0007A3D667|nr:carboxymuconolactone decarboxylase family protein [Nocardia violaceofusca]
MRLPPLPADQWDDRTRGALAALLPRARRNPDGAGPAMSALARHPDLAEAYLGFGVYLLFRSTLPPRVREIAILRIAHRRQCAYEWAHHVAMADSTGLSDADVDGIRDGRLTGEFDRLLLAAVDELDEKSQLSDTTWAALSDYLDERQRMDLVFTVGGYAMVAMAFNTFGIQPDHER